MSFVDKSLIASAPMSEHLQTVRKELPEPKVSRLLAIFAGRVAPLGPKGIPSAFIKNRVHQEIQAKWLGLEGDSQADLTVHGGLDKAIYAYPSSNYALWRDEFPEHSPIWGLGALGENLALAGLDESEVHIGDVFRLGSAILQVTQPRKPCFKLALRYNDDQRIASRMVREGRTGWYFRVLEEGWVSERQQLTLLERRHADWSIRRVNRAAYDRSATEDELREIAALPELSTAWRDQTLASASVISARGVASKFRPFVLAEAQFESASIRSLVFTPANGEGAAIHQPGQHVQIRLPSSSSKDHIVRRYTVSSNANGKSLRISVKAESDGLISSLLHELEVGQEIEISKPQGRFVFDREAGRPVAFISAGVGITPMVPMLNAAVAQDGRFPFVPKILFIHAARDGAEHAFSEQIRTSLSKHPDASSNIFYTQPTTMDWVQGRFDVAGRVTVADIGDLITPEFDIYLCGPAAFMETISEGLKARGIPPSRIKTETFDFSGDRKKPSLDTRLQNLGDLKPSVNVTFAKSGVTAVWTRENGALLNLAEASGVTVSSDCRMGLCGTCASKFWLVRSSTFRLRAPLLTLQRYCFVARFRRRPP
jgi:MOSC domain-containing protein YiiM/ferredoxin-NADP reductase